MAEIDPLFLGNSSEDKELPGTHPHNRDNSTQSNQRRPRTPNDDTQTPASQRPRIEEPQTPPSQIQRRRRVLSHDPFGHSPPAATINLSVVPDVEELPSSHLAALFTSLGVAGDLEIYAGKLAEMGPSRRAAALITTIAGLAKHMDQMSRQILAAPTGLSTGIEAISHLTHEEQVRTHVYSTVFKQFISKAARESMLDEGIEAYHTDQQERSLFRSVIDKLKLQSPSFKTAHLPPKFLQGNNLATQHVHAHVKTQLKHVRHKAQNVLMTGVNPTPNFPHLPPINELCRLLWRHFKDGNNTATDEEIDDELRPRPLLRIRFAFMRLATIGNHFENEDRNVSQWDQMDRVLAKLRRLPVNYTKNWDQLLSIADASLFKRSTAMDDIDRSLLVCPTDEEVRARMASRAATSHPAHAASHRITECLAKSMPRITPIRQASPDPSSNASGIL
ncbi:hypothetical protein PCANC_02047 [Puccinia coronata f. sp. avenae]|uniref:Uncharacterized protein n=1 Tax=Puccinia coronata f. sp. avenae TaxID=200324 RepID=A0A2N5W1Z7_9BASI|nr:hypothetical protein PCANC_02047 [Puccinia coronata f. sp. avenae]